jgi:outer membrane protein assembly factor BamD (BamD/ComL family)
LGSNLFSGAVNSFQGTRGAAPKFEQIKEQFQQLGQDLQSGNLAQAQTDYATLSKEFPGASQANTPAAATAAATTAATAAATTPATTVATTPTTTTGAATTTGATTVAQQFAQLGQDLQSGNLQGAQQDYTNLQQAAQQNGAQQVGGHHRGHHHHGGGFQSASSASSGSAQSNPIAQAFSTLSQDLQAGNLSGAQSAFATLQNDLQQIGGFTSSGASGTSPTSAASSGSTGGTLSVVV